VNFQYDIFRLCSATELECIS